MRRDSGAATQPYKDCKRYKEPLSFGLWVRMEFRELRSLVALAESSSITLTAEKLCPSPGAIHKQLKTLEQEMGVRLYEKVGRRLQLTQATEMMLPYSKLESTEFQPIALPSVPRSASSAVNARY